MSRPAAPTSLHDLPRDLVGVLASFGSISALARLNRQTAGDVRGSPATLSLAEGKRRYETFVAKMLERHVHGGDTMTEMGHFFAEQLIQQVFMLVPFPTLYRLFLVDDAFNLEHDTAPLRWPVRTMTARAGDPVYHHGLLSYEGVDTLTRVVEKGQLEAILGVLSISRHPPGQLFQQMARFVCDFSDVEHELHAYWQHHVLRLPDWASRFVRGDLPHQRLPAAVMTKLCMYTSHTYEHRGRMETMESPCFFHRMTGYGHNDRAWGIQSDWLTSQPVVEFLTRHIERISTEVWNTQAKIEQRIRELESV